MLCRLLLGAIFLLYLICVLILSGMQREDLEVSLLTKLEHYDINISNAFNNVTVLEECLTSVDKEANSFKETDNTIKKPKPRHSMFFTTKSPITEEKLSKTEEFEIDLDSEPVETKNQITNNSTKVKQNKIKPISVQDILKLWESYVTPSSSDANEDFSQEMLELDQPQVKEEQKIVHQINKPHKSNETSENNVTDYNKLSKKSVDDYISKQFQKYLKNMTKTKNVKRKKIHVKLNKSRKEAKILIDSKGVKEYAFLNIPASTKVVTTTTPVPSEAGILLSDSIIDKIAKSVKSLVIEDLRKEFQPLRYKLPTSTSSPFDVKVTESSSTTTLSTTTEKTTTTHSTTQTTLETTTLKASTTSANPLMLLSNSLKKEHLLALEKFLEIFGLQNQGQPVTTTTKQPAVFSYPYTLQPFQKGYPVNFNNVPNVQIQNDEPMVLFKPIYGRQQPNIAHPQYMSDNNNIPYKDKSKLVFTLQSDIEDIPPLQIPNKGVHVFQNIIVSTKSPDSRQNEKQRWWKSKRMPYPFHRQATRAPITPSYEAEYSENFPSQAPIRMSKGKMWGPMYAHQSSRFRRPPHNVQHVKDHFNNVAKYHELLEFGPEYMSGFERPDESQDDGTSQGIRQMHPLTHKKTYNEAPFKKIMQTQQKVNDMLEKILDMNKYPNENIEIQEGRSFF